MVPERLLLKKIEALGMSILKLTYEQNKNANADSILVLYGFMVP